jgi:anti-sigma regulatory factor (Ser/Thr protein kinase)
MKLLYESTVRDESGLLLLRSKIRAVSRRKGFSETIREKMELVCNEMVTNQIKHANESGMVQLWERGGASPALDIFALDYGPGIQDLEHAKKDGTTTTGTMGRGLGAITRLSTDSEIYTVEEDPDQDSRWHGTAIWAQFAPSQKTTKSSLQHGLYLRPFQDSFYNGDFISVQNGSQQIKWLHMDGLGHGKEAEKAVHSAHDVLELDVNIEQRLEMLSKQLQAGRGAVGILAEIDTGTGSASISGVGDMTACMICNGEKKMFTLASGILGHQHRSIEVIDFSFPQQALLITASDGIRGSWNLNTLPQLWRLHPQMIALVMGHVLGRNNDDRSLVIIRKTPQLTG